MLVSVGKRRQIVCKAGNAISGKVVSHTSFVPSHMLTDDAKDKYGGGGALFYLCWASGREEERIIP